MSKHYKAQRRFAFFAIITGFLALLLMLVGVFGPAWVGRVGRMNCTITEGVWFSVACPESIGPCVVSTREWILSNYGLPGAFSVLEDISWEKIQIMTVCGVEGSLNAALVACIVLAKKGRSSSVCLLTVGLANSVASCILVLISCLKVFAVAGETQWRTDWSRILAFVGCLFEFACAVLYVFAVSQSCLYMIRHNYSDENDDSDSVVVFEQDSFDSTEGVPNPGLELPSYCDISTPPPAYTELPDNPSRDFSNREQASESDSPS